MYLSDTYTIYMRKYLHSAEYLRLWDYSNITYKILRAFTCMISIIQDRSEEKENRARNKVIKEKTLIWKICPSYILCLSNYQSPVTCHLSPVRVEFPFTAGSDGSIISSVCLQHSSAT